jgi:DNA-binding NtrC family response regulator
MSKSRHILAADCSNLAIAIATHLGELGVGKSLVCAFGEVRNLLGVDREGVLVLAASTPEEYKAVQSLRQEVCLQGWPLSILIVKAGAAQGLRDTEPMERTKLQYLLWPEECALLAELVRERAGCGRKFLTSSEETPEESIGQRLLNCTPSLLPLMDRIALVGRHEVTVLLTGETGTGKTYLARLIHDSSPRRPHRFLVVPCGALAANLVESELFGHMKGAFTGADLAKIGKFAAVGKGTLLLDEIDCLSPEQQAKLLRVIETGEFEPVGSNETQRCHGRIIAASNVKLEEAVERGQFRRDLYYRLNVMSFHLPPLRERARDIAPLVRGMAARFNTKFQKGLFSISAEAMAALERFGWPGNIRQLENAVQQAVLVSSGSTLLVSHLPEAVQEYAVTGMKNGRDSLFGARELAERTIIQRALSSCSYRQASAAKALGISRVTMYNKMRKYDLVAPAKAMRHRLTHAEGDPSIMQA